jgi:hypothetical protein
VHENKARVPKRGAKFGLQPVGGESGMLPERSNNTQRTRFYFASAASVKPFVYFLIDPRMTCRLRREYASHRVLHSGGLVTGARPATFTYKLVTRQR